MVFTYDPTRLDLPVNQLRLRLGNDGMDPAIFQDEELEYFLGISHYNINWALYYCYMALATSYTQSTGDTLKIGDVTISDNSNKSKYYQNLATQLKNDLLEGNLPDDVGATYVYVGGINASDTATNDILQATGVYTTSFTNQLKYNTQNTYEKYPDDIPTNNYKELKDEDIDQED